MRAWSLWGIGLVLMLAGCEAPSAKPASPASKKNGSDEPFCELCAIPNRAALLKKSQPSAKIDLKPIRYAPFIKDVQAQSGKVVLVYAWASPQAASKKYLAEVVAWQQKYAKDGLVCMTVCIDPEPQRANALKCLEGAQAHLANYLQEEGDTEAWEQCLGCCSVPSMALYERDGKRTAHFDGSETPLDLMLVETALHQLLQAK